MPYGEVLNDAWFSYDGHYCRVVVVIVMVIGKFLLIILLLVSTDLDPVDRIFLPVLHLGGLASITILWDPNNIND